MDGHLWLSILLGILGIGAFACIAWFGYVLTKPSRFDKAIFGHPFWEEVFHRFRKGPGGPGYLDDLPRYLHDSYTEYLQRRNEFWTTYGQVLIAVLIVVVLAILLLTKTISAEAGLPILSGISGFAIAKGVSGSKSASIPQNRNRQG